MTLRTIVTRLGSLTFLLLWGSCVSQGLTLVRTSTLATIEAEATRAQAQERELESRIIGGTVADQRRFPYYTYLDIYYAELGGFAQCGASLIAPDVVLTAGHCMIIVRDTTDVTVWVNRTSRYDRANFGFRRKAVNILVHPGYDNVTFANDIAVIKLGATVLGVPTVQINRNASIPLPNQSLTAIGMGVTSTAIGDFLPDNLMRVSVMPVSFQICKSYDFFGTLIVRDDQMICAGGVKDTCYGDSGSPLLVQGVNAQSDVQVGITSFGSIDGCGIAGAPGVYTRVSHHANWIDKQLCQLSSFKPTACPSAQKPSTKPPTRKPLTKPPTRKPTKSPTRKPTKIPTSKP